jgi:hypothetical protein
MSFATRVAANMVLDSKTAPHTTGLNLCSVLISAPSRLLALSDAPTPILNHRAIDPVTPTGPPKTLAAPAQQDRRRKTRNRNVPSVNLAPGPNGFVFANHDIPRTGITKNRRTCHLAASPNGGSLCQPRHPANANHRNRQTCHQPTVSSFVFIRVHSWPERLFHTFSPRRKSEWVRFCQPRHPANGNHQNPTNLSPRRKSEWVRFCQPRHPANGNHQKSTNLSPANGVFIRVHSCSFVFIRGRIDLFTPSHAVTPLPNHVIFYRRSPAFIGGRNACFTPSHRAASPKAVRFTNHDIPRTEITQNRQTCHHVDVPSNQRLASFVFIRVHSWPDRSSGARNLRLLPECTHLYFQPIGLLPRC